MFICEIWLFLWYFPQFCKSDMSKYGYLEVFQRVPSTSRKQEPTINMYCVISQNFDSFAAHILYYSSLNQLIPSS